MGEASAENEGKKTRRRRWWLDVLLVLAVLGAVRSYQAPHTEGDTLPRLSGISLDGTPVSLAPTDAPTVLHFWATWCGVCEAESGQIEKLSREARVITVASRSGSRDRVASYMRSEGLDFPVLIDPDGTLSEAFGVQAFPTTFFVAKDGAVVTTEVGYTTLWGMRARLWWAGL